MSRSSSPQSLKELTPSLEKRYEELWHANWAWPQSLESTISDVLNEGFYVVDHIRKETILFVGLNPSILKGKENQKNQIRDIADIPYFEPFKNISTACGFNGEFSVADLFAIRCTTQKTIEDLLEKVTAFEKFCRKQFELFLEIVHQAEPCVIVVCNAYASRCMKDFLKIDNNQFDEAIGTYRVGIGCLKNVPVFFSGMLSGQRALDVYSRERLVWQIKHCLKKVR